MLNTTHCTKKLLWWVARAILVYEERNLNLERSLMPCPFSRIAVVGSMKCPATNGTSVSFPYPQGQQTSQESGKKSCKSWRLGRTRAILSSGHDRDPILKCSQPLDLPATQDWASQHPNWGAVDSWWLLGKRESGVLRICLLVVEPVVIQHQEYMGSTNWTLAYKTRKKRTWSWRE